MNREYFTIPGFEKLSKQELFDMSARHILTTRTKNLQPVTDGLMSCSYVGPGCAAAPFLREEKCQQADGIGSWNTLVGTSRVPRHEGGFVQLLQRCHDGAENESFMEDWKARMRLLAYNAGLSTHLIDEDDKKCSD